VSTVAAVQIGKKRVTKKEPLLWTYADVSIRR
jgi:hypothetical protein